MKILALDLGDVWTGTAISDPLKIIATPYQTVKTVDLELFLVTLFQKEVIDTIIIGYPRTMKGTESLQTKKVLEQKEILEKKFPFKKYILWDERLSSKQAQAIQQKKSKSDKSKEHSIAAALILETYLQFLT
ncbi:Holliday junction resolvase RuvX [Candidatus Dependentiae bacterium]|nr:Holliday junction resolvase RuvX [Candidatus Dependentiae bacterium]